MITKIKTDEMTTLEEIINCGYKLNDLIELKGTFQGIQIILDLKFENSRYISYSFDKLNYTIPERI